MKYEERTINGSEGGRERPPRACTILNAGVLGVAEGVRSDYSEVELVFRFI